MADVVGGVGTSHVPSIGAAIDASPAVSRHWLPLLDGYEAARRWLRDLAPDVAIIVYNDHANAFSMRMIPTFVLGVADEFPPADEGFGPRQVPAVYGHPDLAWHLAESLILDGFDLTIANELAVDHGLTVPLSIMCGSHVTGRCAAESSATWPFAVIPLAVNVIQYPPPTGQRCLALGRAIRSAVRTYPHDLRIVIFGTGGMSHQLQGERAGLINSDFDAAFLDRIVAEPDGQAAMPHADYIALAGSEAVELVMWLVMRGALGGTVHEVYRHYHVPASNTAAGLLVLAPSSETSPP